MKKILMGYIPVPHEGYRKWFLRHEDAGSLYVLGEEFLLEFPHLKKDIRALSPGHVAASVTSWKIFPRGAFVLSNSVLEALCAREGKTMFVMPREDVSLAFREKHLSTHNVVFENVFLRWDMDSSRDQKPVQYDQKASVGDLDRTLMRAAVNEGEKSSDWWRRVGALLVKNGNVVIAAHNRHFPSEHSPYIVGDPRGNFKRGIHIELSTAMHAEACVIAESARRGIALDGASLYVTTFPCPLCAKLISVSGIKKLYFAEGYGVLDGEDVLRSHGVEIIFVEI